MIRTKFRPGVVLCLALAWLLSACARKPLPGKETLKVVIPPYLSNAPLFIAQEEGWFAEQGLDVEFVRLNHTAEGVPALDRGELDVLAGIISLGSFNAMARGAAIKVVADKGYLPSASCAYHALMARRAGVEAGDLTDQSQLRGKRVAVPPASTAGYFMDKLLQSVGLPVEAVQMVSLPGDVGFEALQSGSIDFWYTAEPWVHRLSKSGMAVVWRSAGDVTPDLQFGAVLYGPRLLKENPDAGRRFMVAYLKAVRQYNQGKTERNIDILAKYTSLDRESVKEMCWTSFHADGRITLQSVLDFQAWAVKKKLLDAPVTVDRFWDASFVEYANRVVDPRTN